MSALREAHEAIERLSKFAVSADGYETDFSLEAHAKLDRAVEEARFSGFKAGQAAVVTLSSMSARRERGDAKD